MKFFRGVAELVSLLTSTLEDTTKSSLFRRHNTRIGKRTFLCPWLSVLWLSSVILLWVSNRKKASLFVWVSGGASREPKMRQKTVKKIVPFSYNCAALVYAFRVENAQCWTFSGDQRIRNFHNRNIWVGDAQPSNQEIRSSLKRLSMQKLKR